MDLKHLYIERQTVLSLPSSPCPFLSGFFLSLPFPSLPFPDCQGMPASGIIPECCIVCYFGSLSENISQIASGKAGPSGKVTYILVGVTVFFMLAAVTWSTFVVRYDHA